MSCGTTTKQLILKLKFLFSRFGLPETIVSDNDAKIASNEFLEFCKTNGITYLTSPIYHPCSNGQAENSVRTCKRMLKAILNNFSCKFKVNEKLQEYLFEYRNTTHCATGVSPAKLMMGRNLRGRLDLLVPSKHEVPELLTETKKSFSIGELVWCRCYVDRKPIWQKGTITKKIGNRLYLIQLEDNVTCKRHIDQLMRYVSNGDPGVNDKERQVLKSQASSQSVLSTPFQLVDEEGVGDVWQDAVEGVEQVESVEPANQQAETAEQTSVAPVEVSCERVLRPKKHINYKL